MRRAECMASSDMARLLTEAEILSELTTVTLWDRRGSMLVREFSFSSYLGGIDFVNEVARLAEEANHHPEIMIGWRKVSLELTTHSKGGLTELDFALARKVDALLSEA
jgi:4a-hydroxytetrahydrobiopterin dehydratase